jgi:hypothetical protein
MRIAALSAQRGSRRSKLPTYAEKLNLDFGMQCSRKTSERLRSIEFSAPRTRWSNSHGRDRQSHSTFAYFLRTLTATNGILARLQRRYQLLNESSSSAPQRTNERSLKIASVQDTIWER